ncbi:MAG: DUF4837 family protein, partial [Cyclobacteriaceae bacterium]
LPQDELLFDLKKVSPLRMNNVLKKAKNILYVITLDDPTSESRALRRLVSKDALNLINADTTRYIKLDRDLYANGQLVMYLFARTSDMMANRIDENAAYIRSVFESEERERLKKRLFKSQEREIEKQLTDKHGYLIEIPYGYEVAKNVDNFVWIRQLGAGMNKNFFVYSEDYNTQYQLDRIADLREEITGKYLRDSEKEDLYITQQEILPMITDTISFNNKFALRNKGLWKVSDSSAGGPYISYVIVDEKIGKLYYLEGYVYAPGSDKKNFMREMDAILSTFKTPSQLEAQ